VVLLLSAFLPNAVLLKPPPRFDSAPVPPAELPFASLNVGLQPGELQVAGRGGGPPLYVSFSIRASPITTAKRRASRFMASSMRQANRRVQESGGVRQSTGRLVLRGGAVKAGDCTPQYTRGVLHTDIALMHPTLIAVPSIGRDGSTRRNTTGGAFWLARLMGR